MKILTIGLDETTINFLQNLGVVIEKQDVKDTVDLQNWLIDGGCDAAIIDLEKSDIGIYAPRSLRAKKIAIPVIGVSCGSENLPWPEHRAMFLENGGDDLLKSPVNPVELFASLRAVIRRFKGALFNIVEYRNGGATLKVNLTTRSVFVNERDAELTGKERALICLLAESPGRILSKETIITNLYLDINKEPDIKIIDVFVFNTRKKFRDIHPDADKFLETLRGQGYRLHEQPEAPQP